MDSEQTAPTGTFWSGSTLFVYEASKTFSGQQKNNNTFCNYALLGLINLSSVCIRLGFP